MATPNVVLPGGFSLGEDKDDSDQKPGGGDFVAKGLHEQRIVMVAKPVDRDLMSDVTAQLLLLNSEDSKTPITMFVNCPGGDADSGFGIFDAMRFVDAPITTVCMGLAASAAIIIFLGGVRGRRFVMPNSRFMIHQPSTQSQGTASDLEITAEEIEKLRSQYNGIIAKETGKTSKQILKDAHRDFWLTADEAVEYGLATKVVKSLKELKI